MLPDSIVQLIYDFVPYDVYEYMDALTELMLIAQETGVTPLERLQQERAMRRAYEALQAALPSMVVTDAGDYMDVTSLYPAVYAAFVDVD